MKPACAAVGVVLCAGCVASVHAAPPATPELETVYYDTLGPNGQLTGGRVLLPRPEGGLENIRVMPAHVEEVFTTGPGANRVDLVCVGDGYQAAQLPQFRAHAQTAITQLFNTEPFRTYQAYFNVFVVDVVSVDSGVDNDPAQGIQRNTAMDMAFWCNNIERLLCVNVTKARQFAANSPTGFDQIFAIANSTKYGGAGYTSSELATFAGGNSAAPEIAIHELGHSLGNLADEYDYGGPQTYTGPERPEVNVSILTSTQMSAQQRKWFRWLGVNNPAYDGLVGTYEGGYYSRFGIYRPTNNSKMRALGRPFNLPSAESLVIEIYRTVRPIDQSTPTNQVLTGTQTVFVTPMAPLNAPLAIQWLYNNQPIGGATSPILNLCSVTLPLGPGELSVRVTDNTTLVRDPAARAQFLTQTLRWTTNIVPRRADFNADGRTDVDDFFAYLAAYASNDPRADMLGDGVVEINDFFEYMRLYSVGCP